MNKGNYGQFRQQQTLSEIKNQKRDDVQNNSSKSIPPYEEEDDDDSSSMIHQQIYYKSSGLTNFMILDQIQKNVTFPIPKIRVDFRNAYLNTMMRSFFVRDLEEKSQNMKDFAFNFQNMFYTKILYSGIFNNVYCACKMRPDGVFNIRIDTDVEDSYRLRFLRTEKSKTHRFCRVGGQAELNGVFGFCEKLSYQADIALLFDNQLRHSAKYQLSLPFLGDFGSLRMNSGVLKRKIDDSLQFKRRRRKVTFYPFEWQNTYFSYSFNSLTLSHFEPFTSDTQRLYFLSMDYGINRVFRNRHARQFFNSINDVAFLNNKQVAKNYLIQHEAKVAYSIPEQRFQIKPGQLLKYSYQLQNKLLISQNVGVKSILKAKCTYFEKKRFLLTSSLETGILATFDVGSDLQGSRHSLEGSSGSNGGVLAAAAAGGGINNSELEESQKIFNTFNQNSFEIQNVPGYYQLYRQNKNLNFYFALRNKLCFRKFNAYGFKPFAHLNFFSGNSPSRPVVNCGIGVSRHFSLIDSKVDFLITTPNLLKPTRIPDTEFTKFQIIFNP